MTIDWGVNDFAPGLALRRREPAQEVHVDLAEDVLRAAILGAEQPSIVPGDQLDRADEVDQLSQAGLVEGRAGEVLGQDSLERPVLLLDRIHRVVDDLADLGRLGGGLELRPSGVRRHPEHVFAHVLVAVLRVGVGLLLDRVVPLLEGVGDVLEEDQPEGDVLVLARVHVPAHLVRRGPELLLEPEIRTVARAGRAASPTASCVPFR